MDEKDNRVSRAVHTDINTVRRNERSIRALKRLVAFLIVLIVGLGIYVTYPFWLPKLEGIFDKPIGTITNNGKLAGGNFPLNCEDGAEIYAVKDDLLTADAHTLIFYDQNGKERASYSHEFSNPVTRSAGKKVLVFDSGSTGFAVYNKSGKVYSKNADNIILTAALGEDGTAAIVTAGDKYPARAFFYGSDGKLIYKYECTQRIMSVYIDSDAGRAYICTFASENGEIYSQVREISFDSDGEKMVSEKLGCLAIDCVKNNAGNIIVAGDTKMYTLSKDGKVSSEYEYRGDLVGLSSNADCTSVLINESAKNTQTLVIAQADAKSSETYREITGVKNAKTVRITNERVLMLTDSYVYSYAFSGTLAATVDLEKDYLDIVYLNSALYLIGRHGIDKMGFEM